MVVLSPVKRRTYFSLPSHTRTGSTNCITDEIRSAQRTRRPLHRLESREELFVELAFVRSAAYSEEK